MVESMGEKSEQKREYILKKAREVFAKKGFRDVTMKDIVDACEISRGGLYLYFSSTEEIFLEVLSMEAQETDDTVVASLENASAAEVLAVFLKEQKREILRAKKTLMAATYEYLFAEQTAKKDNFLKNITLSNCTFEKLSDEDLPDYRHHGAAVWDRPVNNVIFSCAENVVVNNTSFTAK